MVPGGWAKARRFKDRFTATFCEAISSCYANCHHWYIICTRGTFWHHLTSQREYRIQKLRIFSFFLTKNLCSPICFQTTLWIHFEGSDHNNLILTLMAKSSLTEPAMQKQSNKVRSQHIPLVRTLFSLGLEQVASNWFQTRKKRSMQLLQAKDR